MGGGAGSSSESNECSTDHFRSVNEDDEDLGEIPSSIARLLYVSDKRWTWKKVLAGICLEHMAQIRTKKSHLDIETERTCCSAGERGSGGIREESVL